MRQPVTLVYQNGTVDMCQNGTPKERREHIFKLYRAMEGATLKEHPKEARRGPVAFQLQEARLTPVDIATTCHIHLRAFPCYSCVWERIPRDQEGETQ